MPGSPHSSRIARPVGAWLRTKMHAESSIVAPAQAGLELLIGSIPHRVALAGGSIDQPFVSSRNPSPRGSMVAVGLEPDRWFMERAGMASGTRRVALQLWSGVLPNRPRRGACPRALPRRERRQSRALRVPGHDRSYLPGGEPPRLRCGLRGRLVPGVHRVQLRSRHCALARAGASVRAGESAARGIQSAGCEEPGSGVDPPPWPDRQGLLRRHPPPRCRSPRGFHELLHGVLGGYPPAHRWPPTIHIDLKALLANFQARYPGAMYSGCGGGYLMMIAEDDVPGALRVRIRTESRRNSGHAQNRHP